MTTQIVYYDHTKGSDGKWFISLMAGEDIPLMCSIPRYDTEEECLQALVGINRVHLVRKHCAIKQEDSGFPDESRLSLEERVS